MTPRLTTDEITHAESTTSIAEIEALTVYAYEQLAPEYDSDEHKTIRILESQSFQLCKKLFDKHLELASAKHVLEVGCGTGSLSQLILDKTAPDTELTLLDASNTMLALARNRLLSKHQSIVFTLISILSDAAKEIQQRFDLIVCGLGDPYFIPEAVQKLRGVINEGGHLIVTLPERHWALAERTERLKLPVDQTRFRLDSGVIVKAYSFTYFPEELGNLLAQSGFEIVEVLVQAESQGTSETSVPIGTICALARAI